MGEWSNTLFSCFDNIKLTVITYFVPCYIEGKIAEAVGESCIMHGLVWYLVPIASFYCPIVIRGKVREAKGIDGSCFNDCLMLWVCGLCSMVQEAREMDIEIARQ